MKRILTTLIIAVLAASALHAQSSVVCGAVLDSLTRQGEPAAVIQFYKAPDMEKPVAFTTTDADGKFCQRLTGAGDVKLLSVAAAWAGPALFFRFCFLSLLAAFIPSAVLFLRGRRGARIPMGPFFLAGWASANCTVLLDI